MSGASLALTSVAGLVLAGHALRREAQGSRAVVPVAARRYYLTSFGHDDPESVYYGTGYAVDCMGLDPETGAVNVRGIEGRLAGRQWQVERVLWDEHARSFPGNEAWLRFEVIEGGVADLRRVPPLRRSLRGTRNQVVSTGFHRTAIASQGASAPLKHLLEHHRDWVRGRVLDYGSGRGRDCKALGKQGVKVVCYDPHHPDAKIRRNPTGSFDLVFTAYVVNVLPSRERKAALRKMARLVKPGGRLVVAARGCGDAEGYKTAASWPKHDDGHAERQDSALRRFQSFFSRDMLGDQVRGVLGSSFSEIDVQPTTSEIALVTFQKRS